MIEDLYSDLDLQAVRAFVKDRAEEHLYLDFKLAKARMTRDDRKTLAVATSGFANSAGGVLVWGVETRRESQTSPDTAFALRPISPLKQFMDQLRSHSLSAVSPLVAGIKHKSVLSGDNEGFAVSFIPPSDSGPHMAKLGEDRYYKRNGDTFLRMEHFELEDLFGRRPRPRLSVHYRAEDGGAIGQTKVAHVVVSVKNAGRGAAHHLFLEIRAHSPLVASGSTYGLPRLPAPREPDTERFGAHGQIVLFPEMELDVTVLKVRVDRSLFSHEALIVDFGVAADGLPLERGTISITPDSLMGL